MVVSHHFVFKMVESQHMVDVHHMMEVYLMVDIHQLSALVIFILSVLLLLIT